MKRRPRQVAASRAEPADATGGRKTHCQACRSGRDQHHVRAPSGPQGSQLPPPRHTGPSVEIKTVRH